VREEIGDEEISDTDEGQPMAIGDSINQVYSEAEIALQAAAGGKID